MINIFSDLGECLVAGRQLTTLNLLKKNQCNHTLKIKHVYASNRIDMWVHKYPMFLFSFCLQNNGYSYVCDNSSTSGTMFISWYIWYIYTKLVLHKTLTCQSGETKNNFATAIVA